MKTKEELKKMLDDLIEEINNDPVAQREIARLKQGEGGFLRQLSELSFQDHQAEMRAKGRQTTSPFAPPPAAVRAERERRAAGVAAEPVRKVVAGG